VALIAVILPVVKFVVRPVFFMASQAHWPSFASPLKADQQISLVKIVELNQPLRHQPSCCAGLWAWRIEGDWYESAQNAYSVIRVYTTIIGTWLEDGIIEIGSIAVG
jgi:hypothetical protein